MSAKTKRALRKKRYLGKKDVSQLYMKEYRESNKNAIRKSQNMYYEHNKDVMKFGVRNFTNLQILDQVIYRWRAIQWCINFTSGIIKKN